MGTHATEADHHHIAAQYVLHCGLAEELQLARELFFDNFVFYERP